MRAAVFVALVALLAAPAASAGGEDVRQYLSFIHTASGATGEVPETPVTVTRPHTWDQVEGRSILEVRAQYVSMAGATTNPTADFQVKWNGTPLPDCKWRIEAGIASGGRGNPTVSLFCEMAEFALPGDYTIQVERTANTGEPVTTSTTSIILHQRETISMDLTVTTVLDTWLPVLVFFGATLFFLWKNRIGSALVGTLLALGTQFEAWPLDPAFGLLLLPIIWWLEAFAFQDWMNPLGAKKEVKLK